MKSKSIIRQLTEAPIHTADPEDDFYGDDSNIAEVILMKNKVKVNDLVSGTTTTITEPADVDAVWAAYFQAVGDDAQDHNGVIRRGTIEINVPHSIAHQVITLGKPIDPDSVDADVGAVLGAPAVARVFSDHILKDLVAAPRSDSNKIFTVSKTMVRQLAKNYHLAKLPSDIDTGWGGNAAMLSAAKAHGLEGAAVQVKHDDDDDELYCVFARSGPEFDKLVRTITRDTTSRF